MPRHSYLAMATVLTVFLALGPAATSAMPTQRMLVEVVVADGEALLQAEDVEPGSRGTQSFTVAGRGRVPAIAELRVVDLVSIEDGCTDPELEAGDRSCRPGEGELEDELIVTVTTEPASGAPVVLHEGPLRALSDGIVLDTTPRPADDVRSFVLAWRVPEDVDDVIQGDGVRFDVDVILRRATDHD